MRIKIFPMHASKKIYYNNIIPKPFSLKKSKKVKTYKNLQKTDDGINRFSEVYKIPAKKKLDHHHRHQIK